MRNKLIESIRQHREAATDRIRDAVRKVAGTTKADADRMTAAAYAANAHVLGDAYVECIIEDELLAFIRKL